MSFPGKDAFPAGYAVLLLAAGFVMTRMFQRVTVDRPVVAWLGVFCVVTGALLSWSRRSAWCGRRGSRWWCARCARCCWRR
ncbi:MAG: hypothetical protein IPN17_38110 [Deltaproteobacteria bacterium]|nr:hypothetical protein [Deltaproteobacteria bacterium]